MIINMRKNYKAYNAEGVEVSNFDTEKIDNIKFRLPDGSLLEVPSDKLETIAGGYIKAVYDGEEYIFDDGHRFESVLLGYLVYKDYDIQNITDKEEGVTLRTNLYDEITSKCSIYNNLKQISKDGTDYVLSIDTINNIVSKNQQRKDKGKKIFPFIKSMDKYGTFYVSIFSKCRDDIKTKIDSTSIIDEILSNLGSDWKFVPKEFGRIPLYVV